MAAALPWLAAPSPGTIETIRAVFRGWIAMEGLMPLPAWDLDAFGRYFSPNGSPVCDRDTAVKFLQDIRAKPADARNPLWNAFLDQLRPNRELVAIAQQHLAPLPALLHADHGTLRLEAAQYFEKDYETWKSTLRIPLPASLCSKYGSSDYVINPTVRPVEITRTVEVPPSLWLPQHIVIMEWVETNLDWFSTAVSKMLKFSNPRKRKTCLEKAAQIIETLIAPAFYRTVSRPGFRILLSCADFHQDLIAHARRFPAEKIDRIYLSNIPDYTGMASAFAVCGRVLRRAPTSLLTSRGMVVHYFFETVEQLLQGTIRLPSLAMLPQLFGLKFVTGNTMSYITFSVSLDVGPGILLSDSSKLASMTVCQDYLKNLFLLAAYSPRCPDRPPRLMFALGVCARGSLSSTTSRPPSAIQLIGWARSSTRYSRESCGEHCSLCAKRLRVAAR
eukprot:m.248870 g.248870  ORF g.248870 m.248870 type:complete len:446 (+) comp15863_c0_seq1:1001-2338(+)